MPLNERDKRAVKQHARREQEKAERERPLWELGEQESAGRAGVLRRWERGNWTSVMKGRGLNRLNLMNLMPQLAANFQQPDVEKLGLKDLGLDLEKARYSPASSGSSSSSESGSDGKSPSSKGVQDHPKISVEPQQDLLASPAFLRSASWEEKKSSGSAGTQPVSQQDSDDVERKKMIMQVVISSSKPSKRSRSPSGSDQVPHSDSTPPTPQTPAEMDLQVLQKLMTTSSLEIEMRRRTGRRFQRLQHRGRADQADIGFLFCVMRPLVERGFPEGVREAAFCGRLYPS